MPILFLLNMLASAGMVWATWDVQLADSTSYLMLAEGIKEGNYSQWWPLGPGYPDTTRTPGFPLYLALMVDLLGEKGIVFAQLVFYWLAIWGSMLVIKRYDARPFARNVFLLLLIPLLNVPYYIGQLYPEIPVLAALAAVLHALTSERLRWWHVVGVGLLYGFIFQCKPVFLLFPPLILLLAIVIKDKRNIWAHLIALLIFGITLLPYGYWNLRNHGVFKVTPLESGGGLAHIGIWAGKIPGYTEKFHWGNFTGDEIVRFVPEDSVPVYIKAYEREWIELQSGLQHLLNEKDSIMLASFSKMPRPVMRTYNSAYTMAREKRLMELSIQHTLEDPGYFLLTKAYAAVRIWVIGIQQKELLQASWVQKLKLIFPSLYTAFLFMVGIIVIPLAYIRKCVSLKPTYIFISLLLYFWVFHIPFAIQARYSTPIRLVMLLMIALSMSALFQKRSAGIGPTEGSMMSDAKFLRLP